MSIVNDLFRRVIFDEADRALHKALYAEVEEIAVKIDQCTPDGEDKALALRALHLSLMHLGAALSRHPKYQD